MFESLFKKKSAVELETKPEELTTEQYDKKMESLINSLRATTMNPDRDPEIEDMITGIDSEARKILDKTSYPDTNLRKLNEIIENMRQF